MTFISITRLRVRSVRYLPSFIWHAALSSRQAKRAPGCLGLDFLREANNTYWTKSAWQDEAAMKAFMLAGAHRRVMPKLLLWCNEASIAHWQQDTADLPDWQEAHRRMVAEGRRSKVQHPSPAHTAYEIAEPKL